MIDSYFSGNFSISKINALLPKKTDELLTESFLTDVLNGAKVDLLTALEGNSLLNWTPKAPIRFYHGDDDTIVPFFNSETAVEELKKNGGNNIELIAIKGGGHHTSFFPCFILAHNWFRSF